MNKILTLSFAIISTFQSLYADSSFWPFVSNNGDNKPFKIAFSPQNITEDKTRNESILVLKVGQHTNFRWKVFLPPGTKSFDASVFTFSNPIETKIAAKLGSPPLSDFNDVTFENSNRYSRDDKFFALLNGTEVVYFAPLASATQSSGSTRLSAPIENQNNSTLKKGDWVYFNIMQIPGNIVKNMDIRIIVDSTCYKNWFANAKFDNYGNPLERTTHTCNNLVTNTNLPQTNIESIILDTDKKVYDYNNCNPDVELCFYNESCSKKNNFAANDPAKTQLSAYTRLHYETFVKTKKETRQMSGCIDRLGYLTKYNDVLIDCMKRHKMDLQSPPKTPYEYAKLKVCAKEHYDLFGKKEGRKL